MNPRAAIRAPRLACALALCALTVLVPTFGCADSEPEVRASTSLPAYLKTLSPQEIEAVREAEQAVRDYYQIMNQCLSDPSNTSPSCFDQISVDDNLADNRAGLEYSQSLPAYRVGEVKVVGTKRVIDVDLESAVGEVKLSICTDATDFDVLGPDGTSVKDKGNPRSGEIYIVRKHVDRWQVADIYPDVNEKEC